MQNDIIVLFGKPGAGKGTQLSGFLEGREEQFEVLSVGDLLRKAKKDQTKLGKMAAPYMDSGKLVPDEIINGIVIAGLKSATKPVFTDGFPRTIKQSEAMLKAGLHPIVIDFEVDDDIVIQRAMDRIVCEDCGEAYTLNKFKHPKIDGICDKCGGKLVRRSDDTLEVVKKRLVEYERKTLPVLDFFENHHIHVYTINNSLPEAAQQFATLLI